MPTLVQIREIIESVLFFYEPRLRSKEIRIERRYEPVPDVYCLAGEIQQVFANLISNALDATSEGGKIVISISPTVGRSDTPSDSIRVSVADSGVGMDAHTRRHLFEPFFTTKGETGTGLGLWVSREIMERHNVSVRLRSKPGKGTVFALTLPVNGLALNSKVA
jgi:signal transduction histidine kinase